MPDVENGDIILLGATIHNPSFAINGPLLSRSIIFELRPLLDDDLSQLITRTLRDSVRGFGKIRIHLNQGARCHLIKNACGDARRLLNSLEVGVLTTPAGKDGIIIFNEQAAQESCQRKIVYYDRDEDYHYDTASAFIKSMRGCDPDAAVYWLAKMLYAGEDPRFIMRRILILASEDIGNADPQALILAAAGLEAIEFVGMPESRIILSQLVTYMALAPKSNASYMAISKATKDVSSDKVEEVPTHLRSNASSGAKRLGHGEGYEYPHRDAKSRGSRDLLASKHPYGSPKQTYYDPPEVGFEKILKDRLKKLRFSKAN